MSEHRTAPTYPFLRVYADGSIVGVSGKKLAPMIDPNGYERISIYLGAGRWKRIGVHFVVCEAFHGPRPSSGHVVAHADGDPANNAASNLRWATYAENEQDKRRHGRSLEGERHHQAKLTTEQVVKIRERAARGEAQRRLAREYGVSDTQISNIIRRKSWSHL